MLPENLPEGVIDTFYKTPLISHTPEATEQQTPPEPQNGLIDTFYSPQSPESLEQTPPVAPPQPPGPPGPTPPEQQNESIETFLAPQSPDSSGQTPPTTDPEENASNTVEPPSPNVQPLEAREQVEHQLTKAQLQTVQKLASIAGNPSPSKADRDWVKGIQSDFRLTEVDLAEMKHIAENTAAAVYSRPEFVEASRDWGNSTAESRREILESFVDFLNDYLGIDVKVDFRPEINMNGVKMGGYFDGNNNSIVLSTSQDVHKSFATSMKVVFHEMIHAFEFNRLGGLQPHEIVSAASEGRISYEDAVLGMSGFPGIYTTPDEGFLDYQLNPNEQTAFTAESMFQTASEPWGIEQDEHSISDDHPLKKHMRDMGYA